VARSRSVVVAGAGIGGLTSALALARAGFRVVILEQSARLEETGAGIQLGPNATRILIELGLGERLKPHVVAPESIGILRARDGRQIIRLPLGAAAQARYGAPYWVIHRGDLQAVLVEALEATPDAELRLGTTVEDFAVHANGVTVTARGRSGANDEHGIALVGADGLWSTVRRKFSHRPPQFRHRTAWRAVVPAENVAAPWREPSTSLWLGRDAHVVHYPVKGGRAINIVAIVRDDIEQPGWSTEGVGEALLRRFSDWDRTLQDLLAVPESWLKWSLHDLLPLRQWGRGPVTLVGDAAHPMLPFLAQGGGMAIEDARMLASCLGKETVTVEGPDAALRQYEGLRQVRTAKVQGQARLNSTIYHLAGPAALARDLALRMIGGAGLLKRYDWLYDWRPR
jgi:salicylate hydroxylase